MGHKRVTYNHSQISKWLYIHLKKRGETINLYEYLEEIPEISEKLREDIFDWDQIPGRDDNRLRNFITGEYEEDNIGKAEIKNDKASNIISLQNKDITYSFKLDDKKEILFECHKKKIRRKYILKEINGRRLVYEKGYTPSIDSNLPIDIICRQTESIPNVNDGTTELLNIYSFFFIVSTSEFPDSLIKEIIFCRYYLSKILSTRIYKMILVSSPKIKFIDQTISDLRNNGIGLWICRDSRRRPEIVHDAQTIRAQVVKDIENGLPKDKQKISHAIAENISLSVDKYIHDAIGSVAGIRPEKFAKRYIDKKIFDKIFELERVSYKDELIELVNEHLTDKGDEYEFANEVFQYLWSKYLASKYTHFLKEYEPSMQYVTAARRREGEDIIYRDHYLHQFQVFLLGISIIDCMYDHFQEKYDHPELSWLICSSFHDIAYPVQLYDDWSKKFFKQVFNITTNPSELDLKSNFVNEGLLHCTGHIINSLLYCHNDISLTENWLDEEHEIVKYFFDKITRDKNHGILSSISLLKMIQEDSIRSKLEERYGTFQKALKEIFVPGALAIALHESDIWRGLIKNNDDDKKPRILKNIKFKCDPLSFLMIFCDNVQDWGRPSKALEQDNYDERKNFYLKEFKCSQNSARIILYSPNLVKTEKNFTRKQAELKEIESLLEQPAQINFSIKLRDKYNASEDFTMRGSVL